MLEVRCGQYLIFFQNLFYELLSDITILHVDMFFLHVDMIYLVCRGSNVSSYKRIMSTWDNYILNYQALLFILNGAVVQSTEVVLCHLDRYCNVGEYQYFPMYITPNITGDKVEAGTRIYFHCHEGYYLRCAKSALCLANGRLIGINMMCECDQGEILCF